MKNNPINERIQSYYKERNLDSSVLHKLLAESGTDRDQLNSGIFAGWFSFPQLKQVGVAVAMMLVVVLSFHLVDSSQLDQRVANEIAMNHSKAFKVEYPTGDFLALNGVMNKLDFQIVFPKAIRQMNLQVLGARYCSIQGMIAVQIKLKSPDGTRHTLYETRQDGSLDHIRSNLVVSGTQIRMWNEQGLFMGLAH